MRQRDACHQRGRLAGASWSDAQDRAGRSGRRSALVLPEPIEPLLEPAWHRHAVHPGGAPLPPTCPRSARPGARELESRVLPCDTAAKGGEPHGWMETNSQVGCGFARRACDGAGRQPRGTRRPGSARPCSRSAASTPVDPSSTLAADGTFHGATGVEGTIDTTTWALVSDPTGDQAPRLARASPRLLAPDRRPRRRPAHGRPSAPTAISTGRSTGPSTRSPSRAPTCTSAAASGTPAAWPRPTTWPNGTATPGRRWVRTATATRRSTTTWRPSRSPAPTSTSAVTSPTPVAAPRPITSPSGTATPGRRWARTATATGPSPTTW